jgi:hypothetical protein
MALVFKWTLLSTPRGRRSSRSGAAHLVDPSSAMGRSGPQSRCQRQAGCQPRPCANLCESGPPPVTIWSARAQTLAPLQDVPVAPRRMLTIPGGVADHGLTIRGESRRGDMPAAKRQLPEGRLAGDDGRAPHVRRGADGHCEKNRGRRSGDPQSSARRLGGELRHRARGRRSAQPREGESQIACRLKALVWLFFEAVLDHTRQWWGNRGSVAPSSGGSCLSTALSVSIALPPSNARRPLTIS